MESLSILSDLCCSSATIGVFRLFDGRFFDCWYLSFRASALCPLYRDISRLSVFRWVFLRLPLYQVSLNDSFHAKVTVRSLVARYLYSFVRRCMRVGRVLNELFPRRQCVFLTILRPFDTSYGLGEQHRIWARRTVIAIVRIVLMRPTGWVSTSVSHEQSWRLLVYPQGTVYRVAPPMQWREVFVASYRIRVSRLLGTGINTWLALSFYEVVPAIKRYRLKRRKDWCLLSFALHCSVAPILAARYTTQEGSTSLRALFRTGRNETTGHFVVCCDWTSLSLRHFRRMAWNGLKGQGKMSIWKYFVGFWVISWYLL